ncbi:MAG: PaaI family thioesterase [Polyangiaceae bacterium]
MQHFRALEALYRAAPTNRYYQPEIHIDRGTARVSVIVREDFFHTAGAVHGAVYFKVLDDAAFFAANSLEEECFVLTASFHLHFLRPIQSGTITATARVVSASSRLFVADASAVDGSGTEIARGSGSFMKSRIRLTGIDVYREALAEAGASVG